MPVFISLVFFGYSISSLKVEVNVNLKPLGEFFFLRTGSWKNNLSDAVVYYSLFSRVLKRTAICLV